MNAVKTVFMLAFCLTCFARGAAAQDVPDQAPEARAPEQAPPSSEQAPQTPDPSPSPELEAPEPEVPEPEAPEVAPEASAQESEDPRITEARQRIARAEDLYEREDYEGSLAEFRRTAELLRGHALRFRVLYNIGRCQEKLFLYQDALLSYRAFLTDGGEFSEQAPDVRAKLELLEGLLGTVQISVSIGAYEVWVGDRLIGRDLDELLLPSGTHAVEIRREGYVSSQQQAEVAARQEIELTFDMQRLADEFEGISPAYFVTATVTAVLAAGAGVALGAMALSRSGDIEDRNPALATASESEDIRRLALGADILFGVALLGATSAVIFALFTDWGGEDGDAVRLAPAVGGGEGGLVLEGRF